MEGSYRIGEIADLTGVSKRTVDYYTNLGLLNPIRSESNYRYYTAGCLVRLKMIEALKMKRLTLGEIKKELSLLDVDKQIHDNVKKTDNVPSINLVRKQIRQLEEQIAQLQPVIPGNKEQVLELKNGIMLQSLALVQTLTLYIKDISSYL
ncbi:MAG: MerR family transcriptional regulator [Firmicutes bacterium]|nr:MerR family transcriptional regulator [Bacillota bacterium]